MSATDQHIASMREDIGTALCGGIGWNKPRDRLPATAALIGAILTIRSPGVIRAGLAQRMQAPPAHGPPAAPRNDVGVTRRGGPVELRLGSACRGCKAAIPPALEGGATISALAAVPRPGRAVAGWLMRAGAHPAGLRQIARRDAALKAGSLRRWL